jgi:uridylate kinase
MKLVFSIGGSVLAPDEIDEVFLEKIAFFLRNLSQKNKVWVVAGGGKLARKYIKAAKKLSADDDLCDWLGIYATRLNALLLASSIGKKANRQIPRTVGEAIKFSSSGNIVVMGGTEPKHSTDAVAAELARETQADLLVNASNVDGVYDKDPKKFPEAKLIPKITARELLKMVEKIPQSPGNYALMDKMAVESVIRSKVKTIILNGRNLANVEAAVDGEKFTGTLISP